MRQFFHNNGLRLTVTALCLVLLVGHLIWPKASIDAVTLGLLAFGLLPWLRGILKGVKLPGGFEITLADAEKVAATIVPEPSTVDLSAAGQQPDEQAPSTSYVYRQGDANLALVALRIELEKRIRKIAAKNNIDSKAPSLRGLVGVLESRGVFSKSMARGVDTLLRWGNEAAHGATVDRSIALWAATSGNEVLAALDKTLSES